MFSYRVTKYNPDFRNSTGVYEKDEWIAFSDIGDRFDGVEFTVNNYIETEELYLAAIHRFMSNLDLNSLNISRLEKENYVLREHDRKHIDLYPLQMTRIVEFIQDGNSLNGVDLDNFCRLCLRSQIWGVLEHREDMFVHFGRDYYMYIGVTKTSDPIIEEIRSTGLFVEPFQSPYFSG
jgi:hypothetical protein